MFYPCGWIQLKINETIVVTFGELYLSACNLSQVCAYSSQTEDRLYMDIAYQWNTIHCYKSTVQCSANDVDQN